MCGRNTGPPLFLNYLCNTFFFGRVYPLLAVCLVTTGIRTAIHLIPSLSQGSSVAPLQKSLRQTPPPSLLPLTKIRPQHEEPHPITLVNLSRPYHCVDPVFSVQPCILAAPPRYPPTIRFPFHTILDRPVDFRGIRILQPLYPRSSGITSRAPPQPSAVPHSRTKHHFIRIARLSPAYTPRLPPPPPFHCPSTTTSKVSSLQRTIEFSPPCALTNLLEIY